jgi:dGTPase
LLSDKRIRDLYVVPIGKNSTEHRTEFERDYDRAIFCSPFRRLHDKAQVFPLEPNDTVRTRLAHSLEVSTIARDMSKTIAKWLLKEKKEINEEQAEAIQTIASTCGLLHDLGNPPFGHAGEDAIRDWFEKQDADFWEELKEEPQFAKDFLLFEGNALLLYSFLQNQRKNATFTPMVFLRQSKITVSKLIWLKIQIHLFVL